MLEHLKYIGIGALFVIPAVGIVIGLVILVLMYPWIGFGSLVFIVFCCFCHMVGFQVWVHRVWE